MLGRPTPSSPLRDLRDESRVRQDAEVPADRVRMELKAPGELVRVEAVRRVAQSLEDHPAMQLTGHASIIARTSHYAIRRKYRFPSDAFLLRSL